MAHYTGSHSRPGIIGQVVGTLSQYASRISAGLAWSRTFRETYDELSKLSDRELNDLGFSRGDLTRIAREAADMAEKNV